MNFSSKDVQLSSDDANLIIMSMSIFCTLLRPCCCTSQVHIGNPCGHTVPVTPTPAAGHPSFFCPADGDRTATATSKSTATPAAVSSSLLGSADNRVAATEGDPSLLPTPGTPTDGDGEAAAAQAPACCDGDRGQKRLLIEEAPSFCCGGAREENPPFLCTFRERYGAATSYIKIGEWSGERVDCYVNYHSIVKMINSVNLYLYLYMYL